jgi:histidinol-phosphate/aromatic aminotransferase/cobyric acid decarboxylase-like protein
MACPMQYDLYAPAATVANAVIKTVQLDPNDWSVPRAAVEAAFSDRTKLILINSPHKCAAAHGPDRVRRLLQRPSTCSRHTGRVPRSTDAVPNTLT